MPSIPSEGERKPAKGTHHLEILADWALGLFPTSERISERAWSLRLREPALHGIGDDGVSLTWPSEIDMQGTPHRSVC
jgi:hypothetical protein